MERLGYNKTFLGEDYFIELPKINSKDLNLDMVLNNGEVFNFTHFSLIMHKVLKSAIYVAYNVDKASLKNIKRKDYWHYDEKIGKENQIGNDIYKNNEWDRGHLARRKDICWGSLEEAVLANYDSFCWANISIQHKKFNQGIWNKLENFIFDKICDHSKEKRLSVFTGPINGEGSIKYCGKDKPLTCSTIIPIGFWKTIFYIDNEGKLKSNSFIIKQDKYLKRNLISEFAMFQTYEVVLSDIMALTGLEFNNSLLKTDKLNKSAIILRGEDINI